jgi:hypothetical protein
VSKDLQLPTKRDRYYTIGGSGELEDYTAISLFETPDGQRDAVIGITLKNIPEVSGFIAFLAEKFGIENQFKVAMLELPMIYWKGGTLEVDMLVTQAVNKWIDSDEDPTECFYDNLEDLEFESFYSDYQDALTKQRPILRYNPSGTNKSGRGFG